MASLQHASGISCNGSPPVSPALPGCLPALHPAAQAAGFQQAEGTLGASGSPGASAVKAHLPDALPQKQRPTCGLRLPPQQAVPVPGLPAPGVMLVAESQHCYVLLLSLCTGPKVSCSNRPCAAEHPHAMPASALAVVEPALQSAINCFFARGSEFPSCQAAPALGTQLFLLEGRRAVHESIKLLSCTASSMLKTMSLPRPWRAV